MKRKIIKIIVPVIFLVGVSILLYPMISQYWNSRVQSQAITDYDKVLSNIDIEDYNSMLEEARIYNQELYNLDFPLVQYKEIKNYSNIINVNNNSMMGYISIDKIKVEFPIYHTTSEAVLNVAVGHFEGTSLPIGGPSTHSVLSAHRGLPSAKLFTNLNKLEIGDTFEITVLNEKITYQVDKITVVEPSDVSELEIEEDKDYVTLMTCTPYGINTHRLLVRGARIENIDKKEIIITSEAYQIDKLIVTLVIALPILIALIMYLMLKPVKKKFYEEEEI